MSNVGGFPQINLFPLGEAGWYQITYIREVRINNKWVKKKKYWGKRVNEGLIRIRNFPELNRGDRLRTYGDTLYSVTNIERGADELLVTVQ